MGEGELIAEQIGLSTREAFASLNWISAERAIHNAASAENIMFCKVVMPDRTVYLADDRNCYGEHIAPEILVAESALIENYVDPRTGRQGKLIVKQIEIGKEKWWVLLAVSLNSINQATRSILRSNLLAAAIILISSVGSAMLLSKGISEPIVQLASAAKAFATGRLDHPVDIKASGEVGVLARSFNEMMQELRSSQEQLEDYSKGLEEALARVQESEARVRALADNALDGIYMIQDDHFIYCNQALADMLGYTVDEILALEDRTAIMADAPLGKALISQRYNARLRGEDLPSQYEAQLVKKDGQTIVEVLLASSIVQLEGKPTFIVLAKDIAERKRAGEELRQLKEFNEGIVRTVAEALLIEDTEGIITFINPAMEKLVGYPADELVGCHWRKIVSEGELELVQAKTSQRPAGIGDRYETRLRARDGREMPVLVSTRPLFEEGTFAGVLSAFTDITERVRAEEQLRRYAAELQQANEEVKNFAYIVSHDLRAPLVNLKGFAAELRSSLEVIDPAMNSVLSHLDEAQRQEVTLALQEDIPEALEFIESSVTRMDHFIGAVLKLSRVGRRELRHEPVDMNALVHEALQTVTHQLDEHDSKVTVEPLPQVVADRTSMEQIIGNILGNAVKYLDGDRPGEVNITAERNRDETTFHIRDNGRGISEADMPKVFAPFRRAGKQDVPGEGMGLTYVQTLVRRHGGRIWCESELGVGTTFSFTISNDLVKGGDDA